MTSCLALRLGRVPYGPVLALQRLLHQKRRAQKVPNLVLSLEHEPVITLGRSGSGQDLLLPLAELKKRGVEVFEVERGGAATYHGPGQLVLYPILNLRELGLSVRDYVWGLEEVMIRAARSLGAELFRTPEYPGVWHALGKVGFWGVHVRGWVTMHGLALNVDLQPNGFQWIVPCGLPDVPVVSLREILRQEVSLAVAENLTLSAFSDVFGMQLVSVSGPEVQAWLSQNG